MLIAAIQPILIRLVPKGSKVCFWHLWVGPVLSSKQEESWERTKELCLLQLCNHWHCFGHIWLWVTYSLDNNPNTKCCQQQRVVTSLMSQWQALSGQYPLQQNMGAAHSIAMFSLHCHSKWWDVEISQAGNNKKWSQIWLRPLVEWLPNPRPTS